MTWIDFFFFLRKYLAYHMYKPISIEEKHLQIFHVSCNFVSAGVEILLK